MSYHCTNISLLLHITNYCARRLFSQRCSGWSHVLKREASKKRQWVTPRKARVMRNKCIPTSKTPRVTAIVGFNDKYKPDSKKGRMQPFANKLSSWTTLTVLRGTRNIQNATLCLTVTTDTAEPLRTLLSYCTHLWFYSTLDFFVCFT